MAAAYVLPLEAWNSLLERINGLATNPPEGCDPVEELPPVEAPHKWSETDITAARDKLVEICSDNTFSEPSSGKWRKAIIDELDAAIDNGWCNCGEEQPCCVPQGSGTVQINPGGYYVTIPFSQIVEQYLYGNVSYSDMVAAMGADVVTHLEECVGGPSGQIIHYTLRHLHWTNCIYQDRWLDNGVVRQYGGQDEYWYTCSNTDATVVDSGYVPSFTPGYQSSTSIGSHNYYDQPMGTGYYYDYAAGRWYETLWIGAFDVDAYVYELRVEYICPA
jgi:hypothetical protein